MRQQTVGRTARAPAPVPFPGRVLIKIETLVDMLDCSVSTIWRRVKDDPGFPQPIRLSRHGDWRWFLDEVHAYLAGKADERPHPVAPKSATTGRRAPRSA
jgi:predicted DNA-binding transcriptional regulator AlpA